MKAKSSLGSIPSYKEDILKVMGVATVSHCLLSTAEMFTVALDENEKFLRINYHLVKN